MLIPQHTTLTQYLIEQRRRHPSATGEFNALILSIAQACKSIARTVADGALLDAAGATGHGGEPKKKLHELTDEQFLRCNEWSGYLAGIASEARDDVYAIPKQYPRGRYLLTFDSLDGSSNIDVNVAVASIFSILKAPRGDKPAKAEDFLQPGTEQVAAGYVIYGHSTMLVLTVGRGVVGFTLDREMGDFVLTHPDIRIPDAPAREFAINASNSRFWAPPVRRYVEECLAGSSGPRQRDFSMRWIASLVAEAHRILIRGGVFICPRDNRNPDLPARLRLHFECNPIGWLVEQAGGRASTGSEPVLELLPENLQQRIGFVFGSREEVELIELYHQQAQDGSDNAEVDTPLFNSRGLFRAEV